MLKELNIPYTNITDASLIAIAKNYTELQLLDTCEAINFAVISYFATGERR